MYGKSIVSLQINTEHLCIFENFLKFRNFHFEFQIMYKLSFKWYWKQIVWCSAISLMVENRLRFLCSFISFWPRNYSNKIPFIFVAFSVLIWPIMLQKRECSLWEQTILMAVDYVHLHSGTNELLTLVLHSVGFSWLRVV